jgi:NADP-dependent aldehyde dehydrogenase
MIQGFDPRTGEPVGEPVPETTDAEVDATVAAAVAAFPAWSAFGRRAEALEAVADALDARAGEIAAIADTETALGGERLIGEVARTTGQLRLFAAVLRDGGGVWGGRPPGSAPGYVDAVVTPAQGVVPDLRRINRPVGPVAVFAASNFPFAFSVAGGDTALALAAGCPVVVKAHEGHPVTSDVTAGIVAAALASAGAPAGTFGLIHGVQAGLRLLRHPAVAAAGFTGSTGGGLALAKIAAERPVPIPFYGELGSVNPCVVLPGAAFSRPAAIATGYTGSLTLGAGQFCTNPGLLFVPEDVGLLSAIAEAVGASAGGPMLTGRIFAGYQDAVAEAAGHPGVTELAAGQPGAGPWGATPRVFQVTLKEFAADIAVLSRERFGPAGLVITYPSVEDLLPVLGALAGNLVGTVHLDTGSAEDIELARQVIAVLECVAGRVVCNGWPTGVAVAAAQHHGGPWPATTVPAYTSVGTAAIRRWLFPVAYQDFPPELLPAGLRPAT